MHIKVTEGVPSQSWAGFWVYPLGGAKKWPKVAVGGLRPSKKKMRWTTTRRACTNRKLSRSKRTIEREREKTYIAAGLYIPWLSFSNVMFGSWLASWLDGRVMAWNFLFYMWWWWWWWNPRHNIIRNSAYTCTGAASILAPTVHVLFIIKCTGSRGWEESAGHNPITNVFHDDCGWLAARLSATSDQ
jgi:hypothetical protein